jgi:hypothetical protein
VKHLHRKPFLVQDVSYKPCVQELELLTGRLLCDLPIKRLGPIHFLNQWYQLLTNRVHMSVFKERFDNPRNLGRYLSVKLDHFSSRGEVLQAFIGNLVVSMGLMFLDCSMQDLMSLDRELDAVRVPVDYVREVD